MKKKGLSNLVATVLIVLLALAAIALVWGFLKPAFDRTGVQIDLRTKCIETEVKPTACTYEPDTNVSTVTVQAVSGDVYEIYLVVEYNDDTANAIRADAPPLLATTNVEIEPPSTSSGPLRAKAAAVVADDEGNTEICQQSPVTVECTSSA
ncbi:MAG: hypothetical protein ABIH92_05425 [Nanoarchaeota archaeon]